MTAFNLILVVLVVCLFCLLFVMMGFAALCKYLFTPKQAPYVDGVVPSAATLNAMDRE